MIDFHSHILPCMDDGSKDVAQSIEMLTRLGEQGIDTVVATPHFYAANESVDEFLKRRNDSYAKLKSELPDGLPTVLLGAEVYFYSGIGNLSGLESLCIEGTDILLLEMPFLTWSSYTMGELHDIACTRAVTVALAHIDRYMHMQRPGIWSALTSYGVIFQVNADCFASFRTRSKAVKMLDSGAIQMLGSDCHNMSSRAPDFEVAFKYLTKKLGEKFTEIYRERSRFILSNHKK